MTDIVLKLYDIDWNMLSYWRNFRDSVPISNSEYIENMYDQARQYQIDIERILKSEWNASFENHFKTSLIFKAESDRLEFLMTFS